MVLSNGKVGIFGSKSFADSAQFDHNELPLPESNDMHQANHSESHITTQWMSNTSNTYIPSYEYTGRVDATLGTFRLKNPYNVSSASFICYWCIAYAR